MSDARSDRRVLHLITRFLDGGSEKTTVQTLDALATADADYDLRLGFGHEFDPERVAELPEYVDTVSFGLLRHYNPVTAPFAVLQVAQYLCRENVDLLHTHSTEAGIVGRWAGALAGTPVVVHEIHGDPVTEDRNGLLNATVETLERLSARVADRLVVKSTRIREDFLDRGIGTREQYRLIYHGVELDEYRRVASGDGSAGPAGDGEPLVIFFVGRVVEGKGLWDLLDAYEMLCSDHDVVLRIVGDGPLRDELADAAADRDLDGVTLVGYVDDIAAEYADADVLALPSYREGTPRVVTEALAAGVPVVATDISGVPDQVQDGTNGLLVSPGDTAALRRALDDLLSSDERREEMGAAASESVEKFSLEAADDVYRDLYAELLDER